MAEDSQYERCVDDFTEVPGHFFRLGDNLVHRPRLRLGKRKSAHRWGFLSLLLKMKVWRKILEGSVVSWEQITWRPILGYSQNIWSTWYRHLGSTMTLLSKTVYYLGDGVLSCAEVQLRVLRHNLLFAGFPQV